MTDQWLERFPGILPASLTSSIIHYVPVMRDMGQLTNGYEVSRVGFNNALTNAKSVVLVPGGQIEMITSRSESPLVTLNTKHMGFVRLGMEHAASDPSIPVNLCPIYSFGETQVFDNVRLPASLQRLAMKTLRANVIFCPLVEREGRRMGWGEGWRSIFLF